MVRLIRLFTTIIILSTGMLTGCASVKMASTSEDAKAKNFATHPDKANLYIYRNEFMGAAIRMAVELDGKEIGKTGSKTYFAIGVAPGKHTIVSKAENDAQLDIMTEAGKNYFVWQEVKMGLLFARSKLQLVDEAQGQAGVRESTLLEVNGAPPVPSATVTPVSAPVVASTAPTPAPAKPVVTTPEPISKPVEAAVSQAVPAPAVAAQKVETKPATVVSAVAMPAASNGVTKIERVPFELGVSSVTVERIAKQNSCQSNKGAGLIFKKGPVEVYRVQCDDGRELKARCEMRQCQIFTP